MNRQLIVFAGLPATGKTTLARKLAKALPAFLVRIDTIEQALMSDTDPATKVGPMGYVIADIKDLRLPTWEEVVSREYEPWSEEVLVIDTAKVSSDEAIEKILSSLQVG
jgi:tRNA uridine 5-carbamoylmethylation protein Kti12